jgi:ubiquinone biosynthesis protein UbiJ
MNHAFESSAAWVGAARSAVLDRWTLLCNHVLRSEPQATARLSAHAGRVLCLELSAPALSNVPWWLPRLGPDVGPVWWTVTAAGLLERTAASSAAVPGFDAQGRRADVRVGLRSSSPLDHARAIATGDVGLFDVQGDEALAADVRWVLDHVRWDVAGDIGRVLPQALQAPAARVADAVSQGLRSGARAIDAWWPRSGHRSSPR